MIHAAAAIPRLHVPAYNWWTEALHGVASGTATVFPAPVGLAATFDAPLLERLAAAIGIEVRAKFHEAVRRGEPDAIGLDVWSPNINIFRDPRWGRGQETYGEDPFLTARLAVAYVRGIQGNHPRYLRVIATPQALRGAQRGRSPSATPWTSRSLRPRPGGHVPAGLPGGRHRSRGAVGDVRLQFGER